MRTGNDAIRLVVSLATALGMVPCLGVARPQAGRPEIRPGMYDDTQVRSPVLWPPPRRVRLSRRRVDLVRDGRRRCLVVIGDEADEKIVTGARDISRRVADLNLLAVNLPIRRTSEMPRDELERWNLVVVGTGDDNPLLVDLNERRAKRLWKSNPRAQGYVLTSCRWGQGNRAVLIHGTDPLGALYGCNTFEQLLAGDAGTVRAREATVVDWPGFRFRVTGWGSEAYHSTNTAALRDYVAFLARLRFNLGIGGGCAKPDLTRYGETRGLLQADGQRHRLPRQHRRRLVDALPADVAQSLRAVPGDLSRAGPAGGRYGPFQADLGRSQVTRAGQARRPHPAMLLRHPLPLPTDARVPAPRRGTHAGRRAVHARGPGPPEL